MRRTLILFLMCSGVSADCVVYESFEGSAFIDPSLNEVVCEGFVDQWTDTPRYVTLTWVPGLAETGGYLSIVGDGISFFDETGGIHLWEARQTAGNYITAQTYGGVGYGVDIDFAFDPAAPLMVDGVPEPVEFNVVWQTSLTNQAIGISGIPRSISGSVAIVSPVPEPSSFVMLGLVGLICVGRAYVTRCFSIGLSVE